MSSNKDSYANIEAKRQENLEDNRRFLAALKINDIRDQIKEITTNHDGKKTAKKEVQAEILRRSSRIRKNGNIPSMKENHLDDHSKIKLQLPEHMLLRYQSKGKKIALHNHKAKFGDDENEILFC